MVRGAALITALAAAAAAAAASSMGMGLPRPEQLQHTKRFLPSDNHKTSPRAAAAAAAADADYPARNLSVPVDHFPDEARYEPHPAEGSTFPLRYWEDASHYREGGPVIVLAAGETSGEDRLPFMRNGILAQLARATGGLAVVLEHRYYGASWPVADSATESLRFLTTEQALADAAYFARNFPGIDGGESGAGKKKKSSMTAADTPWIVYGGSYAGAFAAFLRTDYPDAYWGAISSSGVTAAVWDFWAYYEAARVYGPPECVATVQNLTLMVDTILIDRRKGGGNGTTTTTTTTFKGEGREEEEEEEEGEGEEDWPARLKNAFGYDAGVEDGRFGEILASGVGGLQSYNWDPEAPGSSRAFFDFCDLVSADDLRYPDLEADRPEAEALLRAGGHGDDDRAVLTTLATRLLNYIGSVGGRSSPVGGEGSGGGGGGRSLAARDTDESRSWPYQVCTEWGYMMTGSGVPAGQLPLISRAVDLPYASSPCTSAFNLTGPADVGRVNGRGAWAVAAARLALVDGEWDPWRPATPHAPGLRDRVSTLSEPYILIPGAVHHWDEGGVDPSRETPDFPPPAVRAAQAALRDAAVDWVRQWRVEKGGGGGEGRR